MAVLAEVNQPLLRQGLHWINNQVTESNLTDAIVAGLTTVAGLRAITFSGYEVQRRFYEIFQKWVDRLQAIGALTDAGVAAAGSVAGLRAFLLTFDTGAGGGAALTATEMYSLVG